MRLSTFAAAFIVLPALLSACSTVPPSSYARMAAISPLEANPSEIRVAVIAPDQLVIKPGGAIMSVVWQPSSGEARKADFSLEVLSGNATAPQLLSRLKDGQRLYVLRLTSADTLALLSLQREISAEKAKGIEGTGQISAGFRDACWDGVFPGGEVALPLEAHIRTDAGAEWTPLMRDIDLKDILKAAKIASLPACA